ncbi:MAG: AsnC family transcriptional regulator [Bacillota bacterium]|nr:MAG: AsnC family transcriptional regulator [Bacillota bacterium]
MKKLQEKLIKLLKDDARYTAEELAAMLGESAETVSMEIAAMENAGIIVKYTAITDSEKITSDLVEALIEVRVTPKKLKGFDAIAEEIDRFQEVRSLYLMSGGYDIAVFVEGKTLADVARFVSEKLSGLEGVLSTATHFILKKYKIEGQITYKTDTGRQLIHA